MASLYHFPRPKHNQGRPGWEISLNAKFSPFAHPLKPRIIGNKAGKDIIVSHTVIAEGDGPAVAVDKAFDYYDYYDKHRTRANKRAAGPWIRHASTSHNGCGSADRPA